jgi:hypothetical protein
MPLKKVLEVP